MPCTAKTLYQKFETNIPRNETSRPRFQFLHLCMCERFFQFHICEYINRIMFAVWNYKTSKVHKTFKVGSKKNHLCVSCHSHTRSRHLPPNVHVIGGFLKESFRRLSVVSLCLHVLPVCFDKIKICLAFQ